MCGTTSPTKPMLPLMQTPAAVVSDASARNSRRKKVTGMPAARASTSPNARRFRWRERSSMRKTPPLIGAIPRRT